MNPPRSFRHESREAKWAGGEFACLMSFVMDNTFDSVRPVWAARKLDPRPQTQAPKAQCPFSTVPRCLAALGYASAVARMSRATKLGLFGCGAGAEVRVGTSTIGISSPNCRKVGSIHSRFRSVKRASLYGPGVPSIRGCRAPMRSAAAQFRLWQPVATWPHRSCEAVGTRAHARGVSRCICMCVCGA